MHQERKFGLKFADIVKDLNHNVEHIWTVRTQRMLSGLKIALHNNKLNTRQIKEKACS